MSDIVARSQRSVAEAEERAERRALRLKDRQVKIQSLLADIVEASVKDVKLKRYIGLTDDELRAVPLTAAQIAKVRAWEQPKRLTMYALEAANAHVTAMMRTHDDKAAITLNVQNASIVLPEKRAHGGDVVVIDVDAKRD